MKFTSSLAVVIAICGAALAQALVQNPRAGGNKLEGEQHHLKYRAIDALVKDIIHHYNTGNRTGAEHLLADEARINVGGTGGQCGDITKDEWLSTFDSPHEGAKMARVNEEFTVLLNRDDAGMAVFSLNVAGLPPVVPPGNARVGYVFGKALLVVKTNSDASVVTSWSEYYPARSERTNASKIVGVWRAAAKACEDANATALGLTFSDNDFHYRGYMQHTDEDLHLNKTGLLSGLASTFAAQTHDRIYETTVFATPCNQAVTFFDELMAYNATGDPAQRAWREISVMEVDTDFKATHWSVWAEGYFPWKPST